MANFDNFVKDGEIIFVDNILTNNESVDITIIRCFKEAPLVENDTTMKRQLKSSNFSYQEQIQNGY